MLALERPIVKSAKERVDATRDTHIQEISN